MGLATGGSACTSPIVSVHCHKDAARVHVDLLPRLQAFQVLEQHCLGIVGGLQGRWLGTDAACLPGEDVQASHLGSLLGPAAVLLQWQSHLC